MYISVHKTNKIEPVHTKEHKTLLYEDTCVHLVIIWDFVYISVLKQKQNRNVYCHLEATLNNNTSEFGTLNVSGFTTLNNNTTIVSSFNVSGFTSQYYIDINIKC